MSILSVNSAIYTESHKEMLEGFLVKYRHDNLKEKYYNVEHGEHGESVFAFNGFRPDRC